MSKDTKTIVALIALADEHTIFQTIFPVKTDCSTMTQIRLEHDSGREDIRLISVLAEQMGSQSALLSADQAITDFQPDLIVVVGIAGGISGDLMIGDVSISNEIMDVLHNNKISEKAGVTDISFAPDFYSIDAELVSSFTFFKVHPDYAALYADWRLDGGIDDDAAALGDMVRAEGPDIVVGPLACGPVVASEKFNEKLKSLHRKVAAIETESGGIFCRLTRAQIPAIAIRGISDHADGDKEELEKRSKGGARRLAMANASRLLKQQMVNDRFTNVASRYHYKKTNKTDDLFPETEVQSSIVSDLDAEIRSKLAERSPEFKAKPESFYLPIPRAQKINYADELAGKELESPDTLINSISIDERILIRLPRSYPSQALGWSLAHSLIRQQIEGKVVLPYVIGGDTINPPNSGFKKALPASFTATEGKPEYLRVVIIEEPLFHARNRMKYLAAELKNLGAFVLVITKAEDNVAAVDDFIKENGFKEYEIAPVSFSETAFFLEKAFDMTAREAEVVAIRLDDTFRKFRLDAHPTYFAGIQEEALAALINANKRAELIQLAVDALLSLMVAADKSVPPLSRTTRERFLRSVVLEMACGKVALDDTKLLDLATRFLADGLLPTPAPDFLAPFFDIGLLYRLDGVIHVTHPYLESYLLAQALRENLELAEKYFRPDRDDFNFYAFDLYCEMGPACSVIEEIAKFGEAANVAADRLYQGEHIYVDQEQRLTSLSSPRQLVSLTQGLMDTAERMDKDETSGSEVRGEKQRLLDARRYVRSQVGQRNPAQQAEISDDVRAEFDTLNALSRSLSLAATAVGSGSESIGGDEKVRLANLVLQVGDRFSDIWTRNRLRVDFTGMRNDLLADENIWQVVDELGAGEADFEKVKADLQLMIHSFELNTMIEPMGRVFSRIAATAGVRVLAPVLDKAAPDNQIQRLLLSAWFLEVDPARGKDSFKAAVADYRGSPLMRIVLASHLLWRVFWHHYKTAGARHFVNSARRALRPISLAPSPKRIEDVRKGPVR